MQAGATRSGLRVAVGVVPHGVRQDIRRQDGVIDRIVMPGLDLRRHLVGVVAAVRGQAADPAHIVPRGVVFVPAIGRHSIDVGVERGLVGSQARLFIAGREHFAAGNRQRAMARIATGNYDAVIVSHRRLACARRRCGPAAQLLRARPRHGSPRPFFFPWREGLLDRAQGADLFADFDDLSAEFLKSMKLGHLMLRLAQRRWGSKSFRGSLASHSAR